MTSITTPMLVRFENRLDFGTFCMQIRESGIPYRLAGRHTLAMAQEQLDHLPEEADKFIKMCYESRRVQIESEPPPTGERYLPTEEETKNSLRKLAAEFDDLPENP